MIRDQFKDQKKVTTKEARKKSTMGERNYYAKQIGKLQDLGKSIGVSMIITTVILFIAFVLALLLFILTNGEKDGYETWRFVVWTSVFGASLIFTIVWYAAIKPANAKKIEYYRHELERINAQSVSKAKGIYALYGEEFKKRQQQLHEEEKARIEKQAKEKYEKETALANNKQEDSKNEKNSDEIDEIKVK